MSENRKKADKQQENRSKEIRSKATKSEATRSEEIKSEATRSKEIRSEVTRNRDTEEKIKFCTPQELAEGMETLRQLSSEMSVELSDQQLLYFSAFYTKLIERNRVMNLTAITELDEVVKKHFLDSLSLVKAVSPEILHTEKKLMDLGTGAGFPGIPLSIAFPEIKYTLADSLNKRINFIREYIDENRFKNVTLVHGRAEDLARDSAYRESFDICVSRAVANLSSLSEYCIPFIKKNGYFVSYKAGNSEDEIVRSEKAVHMLGGRIENVIHFTLPGTDLDRVLVVIRKERNTHSHYPRKAGVPSKEPLS